jgi:predicted phage terminase large subunit-like protein
MAGFQAWRLALGGLKREEEATLVFSTITAESISAGDDTPLDTLAWGQRYLPAYFVHPPSAMHVWLAEQLDMSRRERGMKVNLIGPRGSAKSTVATLCHVLRSAIERRERYIWIISDTKEQARTHLDNVRIELEENDLLRPANSDSPRRGRHWRATSIQLPNRVTIESYGTGQRIRGRRRAADRPTLIVCDDLQNDSHIVSAAKRAASRQWFQGTLLNAGTRETNIINLATALHREALALELHRKPGWTSRIFAAIESWPTNIDLWHQWELMYCAATSADARNAARAFYDEHREAMDAGAVVLWHEVEDLYTLMQLRVEIGRTAFEREKQGSPVNPEMCEWPESYFEEHIWFDAWPAELTVRTIALDPSKGRDARHGDYSAYVLLGIDGHGVMYVEADLARRPTPQMVADGVALCLRFRPDAFGVEANQYQELLCGEFSNEFKQQGVFHVAPCGIHNGTNKLVRIRRLGPHLSNRRLRFLRTSVGARLLVDQLRDFPTGAHDDGPDALEMALRLADDLLESRPVNDGLGNRLPISV